MKKISKFLTCLICVPLLVCSCAKTTEQSEFNEFELKCQDGMVRSAGIYISKGINTANEYPVIYMADGLVFKECGFRKMLDSLTECKAIRPVVIACSYENKKTIPGYRLAYRNAEYVESLARNDNELAKLFDNHYSFFVNEFIPYVQKAAPVSASSDNRLFFGTSNSADFGITLSLRNPGLISEYWCFSPVFSNINEYGILSSPTLYSICWGAKEEVGMEDYFPNLLKDIRKRGGTVRSWVFNGGHDRNWWKFWFAEELKRRFPYE